MHRILLILIIINCTSLVQAQNYKWAQAFHNTKSDKINAVRVNDSGFVFASGYFGTNIQIGTNNLLLNYTGSQSSKEAFVAKLDSNGVCLWARSAGNGLDDRVLGMDVDHQGNVVIGGTFWSSGFNYGAGTISGQGGGDQGFLVKYGPTGNVLWASYVTNANYGDDQVLDVAIDEVGDVYATGFMTGNSLKVGGNVVTASNANGNSFQKHSYWLAKFKANGTPEWAHCFGNLPFDTSYGKYIERDIAICTDKKDGVYITGGFDHTWPFGTTSLTSSGGYDVFVMKYDTAGVFQWATSGGSRKDDWSNGICADNKGFIYVTGEHRDSLIYDTVLIKNYDGRDVFVMKIDAANGKPVWGKRAGSNKGSERGNSVWADTACNVYVAGDVWAGAEFGDNITIGPNNKLQAFVAKISPEGKWRWVSTGGGADSNDRCSSIDVDAQGRIYAGGYYRTPATFGTTTLSIVGSTDCWLARIDDTTFGKGERLPLIRPIDSIKCANDTIQLWVPTPDKYALFDYNPKGPNVQFDAASGQFIFTTLGTTTYTINILGKDLCAEPDSIIFTIIGDTLPNASFILNPVDVPNYNPVFNLTNTSTNSVAYQWFVNDTLIGTDTNYQISNSTPGKYCFTLVASNKEGCADTATQCGNVFIDERVEVPNAFTPNGDNLNPSITPIFFNISPSSISEYKFEVFNRFGTLVYRSTKIGEGWDGNFIGTKEKCDVGAYYYLIKYNTPNKQGQLKYGDILLIQ
jgi:gliding motility-associated-like protein